MLPWAITLVRHPREGGDLEDEFKCVFAHVVDGCKRPTILSV